MIDIAHISLASVGEFVTHTLFPLFAALAGFGILITVHEFGHFIFCKIFNVDTPIFSIGFGPVLIDKKIGTTEFRLSLIPLGGFCAVAGAEIPGEDGHSDTASIPFERTFDAKNYVQKLLILMGGILCNLLFAYAALTGLNWGTQHETRTDILITSVQPQSTAAYYDLRKNDIISGYNNTAFPADHTKAMSAVSEMLEAIKNLENERITLHINREGTEIKKEIIVNKTIGFSLTYNKMIKEGKTYYNSLGTALSLGIAQTNKWIGETVEALKSMFVNRSLRSMGGPVMMLSSSFSMARKSISALIEFLATISISLALINLIPFGPLDGGQLLFTTIEGIIRQPLPSRYKERFLVGTWYLFIAFFIFLTYRDIMRLFS